MEDRQIDLVTRTLSLDRHRQIAEWLKETRRAALELANELDKAYPQTGTPMRKAHALRSAIDDLRMTLLRVLVTENHTTASWAEVSSIYSYGPLDRKEEDNE